VLKTYVNYLVNSYWRNKINIISLHKAIFKSTTRVNFSAFYNHKGSLFIYTSKILKLYILKCLRWLVSARRCAWWQTTLQILKEIKFWIIQVLKVTLHKVNYLTQCTNCSITVATIKLYTTLFDLCIINGEVFPVQVLCIFDQSRAYKTCSSFYVFELWIVCFLKLKRM
jgi:hypothetical protein